MYIIFITYTECISLTEKSGLSYRRRNWNCKKKKNCVQNYYKNNVLL